MTLRNFVQKAILLTTLTALLLGQGIGAADAFYEQDIHAISNPRIESPQPTQLDFTETIIDSNFSTPEYGAEIDIDQDNDIDILMTSYYDYEIAWYENDGAQNFTRHIPITGFIRARSVDAGDIDGDGDLDIAGASGSSGIAWWENDGTQSFSKHTIPSTTSDHRRISLVDLDQDLDLDLLDTQESAKTSSWWQNDGAGNFSERKLNTSPMSSYWIHAADLDRDTDLDILTVGGTTIRWWENNGTQNFSEHILDSSFSGLVFVSTALIDNDSQPDILAADKNNRVLWWRNNGNGSFTKYEIESTYPGVNYLDAGDLDLDGDIDLLGANNESDETVWWENDGSQNFTRHQVDSNANHNLYASLVDLDLDTDLDVVASTYSGDQVVWHKNLIVGGIPEAPVIEDIQLEHPAIPIYWEKNTSSRSVEIFVTVSDPNGLGNIDQVDVDVSALGGTTVELDTDYCLHPEDGLYCGNLHVEPNYTNTGSISLDVTVTDRDGLSDHDQIDSMLVMLLYDIYDLWTNDPDSIIGEEVWIMGMPSESLPAGEVGEGLMWIWHFFELLSGHLNPFMFILVKALEAVMVSPYDAQFILGTHYAELSNMIIMSWNNASGAELLPLSTPYYLYGRVEQESINNQDFYYFEVLQAEEDLPTVDHPYYPIPQGYSYATIEEIRNTLPIGSQVCTIAIVTERDANWPNTSYLRAQLSAQSGFYFIVQAPGNTPVPGLKDLALFCGTKSDPVLPDTTYTFDTTVGQGMIQLLRGFSYSVVYGHEYLGEPSIQIINECPTDIHLFDDQGNHTGAVYDAGGNVIAFDEQIPGVFYLYGAGDTPEYMLVSNPRAADYDIQVRGTDDGVYTQTIRIFNRGGEQTYSSVETAIPISTGEIQSTILAEIPTPPTSLQITFIGAQNQLDWEDNPESDLVGYFIYRSLHPDRGFFRLNDTPHPNSDFIDSEIDLFKAYYYYITAVDADANESTHNSPRASLSLLHLPYIIR